jgi:hypothetical protein
MARAEKGLARRGHGSWTLNGVASFLAGMPARESPDYFSSHRESEIWKQYSAALDCRFAQFEQSYGAPFSHWAQHCFRERIHDGTVFYPFSGPDFTFAHLLYPEARSYILCGLEPCGTILDPEGSEGEFWQSVLQRSTKCITHFLQHSYFLTTDLRDYIRDDCSSSGVLPLLLILLARAGCVVDEGKKVRLISKDSECSGSIYGIQISFKRYGRSANLVYLQQDLRDLYFSENSILFRLISETKECALFSKSASYLLHEPNFSQVRDFIFARCSVLVQDPSSIPYRLFEERGWNVNLFGCYLGTLPVFDKYEQADLCDAYQTTPTAQPLGFGIGYLKEPASAALIAARPSISDSSEDR